MRDATNKFLFGGASGLGSGLERRTLKDAIVDKLSALIASGILVVGDELPGERVLASSLSVSRETMRGAIQTLAARGILDVSQGMRTLVAKTDFSTLSLGISTRMNIDNYDIHSVHSARMLIEQQVVGDAAERISADAIARLRSNLAVQKKSLTDPVRFLICDREFHVTIYRECGNTLLADIVTDLYTYILDFRRRAICQPGAIDGSVSDHQSILTALERRDRKAAMAAFAVHEERIYETSKKILAISEEELGVNRP